MLNLDYYHGNDLYSDGDIEDEIFRIYANNEDISDILTNDNRWPLLYHLSPMRRNLLEWYPFEKNSSLLEVGAGCGALTGLFCEEVGNVVAVELSKRRAEIIERRYVDNNNLVLMVGNILDMNFKQKFDNITLIGVLEYARAFINKNINKDVQHLEDVGHLKELYKDVQHLEDVGHSTKPYMALLSKVYDLLSEKGKLFIAIENKFGLKYFAGAPEEHTGKYFDSIEGYLNYTTAETFGKIELIELLNKIGFKKNKFYYPYPDYKFPEEIYSDEYLPDYENVLKESENFDNARIRLFSEQLAFKNIIKNKMFDFFSNSFLIISQKGD